jgi:hypothetical protein
VGSLYVDEFTDRGIVWSELSDEERARHPAVQAAYMTCLDHFFGEFLEALPSEEPVLIAIAALFGGDWQTIRRRFAFHGGRDPSRLHAPALWWTRQQPGCSEAAGLLPGRSPAIVQPQDLVPTLLEWFEPSRTAPGEGRSLWPILSGTAPRVRDTAIVDGSIVWTERDVTVIADPLDTTKAHRFLWPEDLWFVNDVASVSPESVAERAKLLNERRS